MSIRLACIYPVTSYFYFDQHKLLFRLYPFLSYYLRFIAFYDTLIKEIWAVLVFTSGKISANFYVHHNTCTSDPIIS